ncbi:MAG TPA: mannose-1-phosphate guanylyltransferase [Chthoniobacterales bacterium]
MTSLFALILAGGSGERFWPLSRRTRPKQLLRLVSDKTLLEETIARLDELVPRERILVLTNVDQEKSVRELLPDLPPENIVAEPAKRDTAAAVALATAWLAARDHQATMLVLPADHVIKDRDAFQQTIRTAAHAAEVTGALVTIGIKPTWPCPGYGYIEQGAPVAVPGGSRPNDIFHVRRFREKPNAELADTFVRQGTFRWNAGIFVWSVPTVLSEFNRHAPELADFISQMRAPGQWEKVLRNRFGDLPIISFDYAIMEKADRVLMVEASFDWDDVGGWRAVAAYLGKDEHANAANCNLTTLQASDNIVFTDNATQVALLGVHNLIVVRDGDTLLVCNRRDAEKVKDLVNKLPPALQ